MTFSAAAWIAIGAAGGAAVAVGLCAYLLVQLRRVRASQLVLLNGGKDDLIDFAVSLQGRINDLHHTINKITTTLTHINHRINDSITNTSLVRYDAYEGAGGHQSASIALLDAARSGIV